MKYVANPVEVDAKIITGAGPLTIHGVMDFCLDHGVLLELSDGSAFKAPKKMIIRYLPVQGDYLVESSDKFMSVVPKDVFERKYRPFEE